MNKWVKAAGIFLVLFGLPALSWYYLQAGLDWRKKSLSELKKIGRVGDFQFLNQNNAIFTADSLKGKVAICNFVSTKNKSLLDDMTDKMSAYVKQFNKTDKVIFLSIAIDLTDSVPIWKNYMLEKGIKPATAWQFLSNPQIDLSTKFYLNTKASGDLTNFKYAILIDTSRTIRYFYDFQQPDDLRRLIQHTALLIPVKKDEKPKMKRDAEK